MSLTYPVSCLGSKHRSTFITDQCFIVGMFTFYMFTDICKCVPVEITDSTFIVPLTRMPGTMERQSMFLYRITHHFVCLSTRRYTIDYTTKNKSFHWHFRLVCTNIFWLYCDQKFIVWFNLEGPASAINMDKVSGSMTMAPGGDSVHVWPAILLHVLQVQCTNHFMLFHTTTWQYMLDISIIYSEWA